MVNGHHRDPATRISPTTIHALLDRQVIGEKPMPVKASKLQPKCRPRSNRSADDRSKIRRQGVFGKIRADADHTADCPSHLVPCMRETRHKSRNPAPWPRPSTILPSGKGPRLARRWGTILEMPCVYGISVSFAHPVSDPAPISRARPRGDVLVDLLVSLRGMRVCLLVEPPCPTLLELARSAQIEAVS